mmetsp:Transcript_52089/g.130870  ORF Transcript_52089/g.130870 Transcript_52089/m.130870 type:complete len:82 (-) Transcript_52089:120-365(-)
MRSKDFCTGSIDIDHIWQSSRHTDRHLDRTYCQNQPHYTTPSLASCLTNKERPDMLCTCVQCTIDRHVDGMDHPNGIPPVT